MIAIRRPRPWTEAEEARLQKLRHNHSIKRIAQILKRTEASVLVRLKRFPVDGRPERASPPRVDDPPRAAIEQIVNELRAARGCEPVAWPE